MSTDKILKAKFAGTRDQIEKHLQDNNWQTAVEFVQKLEDTHEIGPYWLDLLKAKYTWAIDREYSSFKREMSGSLLFLAVQTAVDSSAKSIFEVTTKYLEVPVNDIKSLLLIAAKRNLGRTATDLIDCLEQDDLRSISEDLLQSAHGNNNSGLVRLIEKRIDFQSPYKARSLLPTARPAQIADIEFTDVKQAIADVMLSGRSSDALQIGRKILKACSMFFEQIQKNGHQGLTQGLTASNQMHELAKNASDIQKSLETVRKNTDNLTLPDNMKGKLISLFRQLGLATDPKEILMEDFNSASQMIESTLQTSEKLMRGYEDFQQYAPQIDTQLEELCTELSLAIEKLDAELLQTTDLSPEAQNKLRLKDVFQSIQYNATATKGFVGINAKTCNIMLDTEAKFATSVMNVQSAINAISTATIMALAEIKQAAIPVLDDAARQTIEQQLLKASNTLSQLSQIAQSRNDNMGQLARSRQEELTLQAG